jgi:dipeptidyl aminopeptidase/acylaminoacyl peptidase
VSKPFKQIRLHAARKITCTCDGWPIEALVKTPQGKGPWPLLVAPHGGPQGQSSDGFQPAHELFLKRGWAMLMPNFRGSTGRGREFLQRIIGDWGDGPMRDIMAGVDWCIEHGIADPKRLMVYGGSYGGFITTWMIGHTRRFKAAVAQCAVINQTSMYGTTDIPTFMAINLGGKPAKRLDAWWQQSPLAHVGNVKTPTLVVTGLADERVHPTQSFEYYRHLKATGTPCDLALYPREGHSIVEPHHVIDLHERVIGWLGKYLKNK